MRSELSATSSWESGEGRTRMPNRYCGSLTHIFKIVYRMYRYLEDYLLLKVFYTFSLTC